jgi:hypothetical protein
LKWILSTFKYRKIYQPALCSLCVLCGEKLIKANMSIFLFHHRGHGGSVVYYNYFFQITSVILYL